MLRGKPTYAVLKGIFLLLAFALLLNLPYIHLREFQGEEGRRVIIAQHMLETGEWIVPYFEGKVYLNKPPLFNWALAVMFKLTGVISEASARMVSVIAAFLCAISLSLFWKKVAGLQTAWFILPGLLFLTFSDVMDKTIRAEIDMTFTFFVTIAVVFWFYYFEMKKNDFAAWLVALGLISLSTLTKGVQAPAFFYCGIIPYLFYKKQIQKLYSLSHVAGLGIFLFIFALWFVPLASRVNVTDLFHTWFHEILARQEPLREGGFLRHLIEFPFYYVLAYLPWIPLLLLWSRQPLEKEHAILKNLALYCLFFLAFSLPFYWILPGARLRYVMPLSGALAILITMPVQALMSGTIEYGNVARRFFQAAGAVITLFVISSPFWAPKFDVFGNPVSVVILILLLVLSIFLVQPKTGLLNRFCLLLIVTLLAKVCWASFYFPYHAQHLSYYRSAANQINQLVPHHAPLYDFKVNNGHLAFYLERPVILTESLENPSMEDGSFVFMEKKKVQGTVPEGFSFVGSVKARRVTLFVYMFDRDVSRRTTDGMFHGVEHIR